MRFLVSLLVFFTTCTGPQLQLVENHDEDGSLLESYHVDESGKKQDTYQRYVDDQLRESCQYRNDTLDGLRIIYDSLGRQRISEMYQMGSFEGPYKTYYQDGTLEQKGRYVNNTMEGTWTTYYPSGQIMEEVTMLGNEENGPFTEYHQNGAIKALGTYLNGPKEDGKLQIYDENGDLEREMECTEGICHTVKTEESQ